MNGQALGNALASYIGRRPAILLDNEIQRLIGIHGEPAVREATKRLTAMKQGRKPEKDWQDLEEWIEQDARDWLDGLDPFKLRSNYFLAKTISKAKPGHNQVASHRRILGKLSKRRTIYLLMSAWNIAEFSRPYADYFRVCEALAATGAVFAQTILGLADSHRGQLERYRGRFGDPSPSMTVAEIQEALKAPLPLSSYGKPLGLFGNLSKVVSK